jgi:hypothetical protein
MTPKAIPLAMLKVRGIPTTVLGPPLRITAWLDFFTRSK